MKEAIEIILAIVGLLALGMSALEWSSSADNSDAQALQGLIALVFLAVGAVLLLIALLVWVL